MMAFLHIYLKYTQPLFMQALMGLKGLYDSNEIALHIFGRKAEGDLKRPFVAPPGLLGCTSSFSKLFHVLLTIACSHWPQDRCRFDQGGRG